MVYEQYIPNNQNPTAFAAKVKTICNSLGIDPNWLMFVMYYESRFNPAAKNSNGGAVGLIQFYPDVRNGNIKTIGGTKYDLTQVRAMSGVNQLDIVKKYYEAVFKTFRRPNSYYELKMLTFFPVAIDWEMNRVLQTSKISAGAIASANPGMDQNNSGKVTKQEYYDYVYKQVPEYYRGIMFSKSSQTGKGKYWLLLIPTAIAGYFVRKKYKKKIKKQPNINKKTIK